MKTKLETYEVVVCGGGLAGVCAALASARAGRKTCLIQDRPVLGGNSSSEVRVTPHGAAQFHDYARETGILSELLIRERACNHETINENGWVNSVWDMTLYDAVQQESNLTCHLNTTVTEVELTDGRLGGELAREPHFEAGFAWRPSPHAKPVRLRALHCRVANAEVELEITGDIFIDCSGDGLVADRAGCEWRMGEESRAEFDEPHAPLSASTQTMGNSIHIRCRDMGRPCAFAAPDWAVRYEDPAFFYEQGRKPHDPRGGYWWIEIGVPWHTIHDNEQIRHQLTRHALGVWDWMKNRDPVMKTATAHYALDFIGQVPGKRESRRIVGLQLLTEHSVQIREVFPDEIAFGGWFLDLHTPGGLLAASSEPEAVGNYNPVSDYAAKSYCGPYGIPLGILISKDVDNLLMAGRNVSVTHAALGTVRVMATTALMGQAAGSAAAIAVERHCLPAEVRALHIRDLQRRLLRDGCFLPNVDPVDPDDLAPSATVTASSEAVFEGLDPDSRGVDGGAGGWKEQDDVEKTRLRKLRAQWIGNGRVGIDRLEVLLTNLSNTPQPLHMQLWTVESIWDYRVRPADSPLREVSMEISPGGPQWIEWPCALSAEEAAACGGYLRLDLAENPELSWLAAGRIAVPGHTAAFAMNAEKMRRQPESGRPSFRLHPPQPCFPARAVTCGAARPHRAPNLWRSDPAQTLPQWLELTWPRPQRINRVELAFAGHLVREFHQYPPFYRDPQTVRDYRIFARVDGDWREVLRVMDNLQTLRRHVLEEPLAADALRLQVDATHGDPAAAVYNLRVFAD